MELITVQDVVSVTLFDLQLSESELQVFADSLAYLLTNLDENQFHRVFNDEHERELETARQTREFVQELYEQIMDFIKAYCRDEFLSTRFKDWNIRENGENK